MSNGLDRLAGERAFDVAALRDRVVARFAEELAEAMGECELTHLARRAEAHYNSDLGARMRRAVDEERARRREE